MTYPDVLIIWFDPLSIDDWHEIGEMREPSLIRTVGQLVAETDDAYKVALNVDDKEGNCSCAMIIPKCNVKLKTEVLLYAGKK
jgi:hypothetical protein